MKTQKQKERKVNKTLVLILGWISCFTIIGLGWGLPMIFWALDIDWEF